MRGYFTQAAPQEFAHCVEHLQNLKWSPEALKWHYFYEKSRQ